MYVVYISATDGVLYLPVSLLFRAVHSKSDAKIRCPVALRAFPVSWVTIFCFGNYGKCPKFSSWSVYHHFPHWSVIFCRKSGTSSVSISRPGEAPWWGSLSSPSSSCHWQLRGMWMSWSSPQQLLVEILSCSKSLFISCCWNAHNMPKYQQYRSHSISIQSQWISIQFPWTNTIQSHFLLAPFDHQQRLSKLRPSYGPCCRWAMGMFFFNGIYMNWLGFHGKFDVFFSNKYGELQ